MANERQLVQLRDSMADNNGCASWNQWREKHAHMKIDLINADLRRANLISVDLTRANLTRAALKDADLTKANLMGADLRKADLSNAHLLGAHFALSILKGSRLADADLSDVDLTGANLARANLARADLTRACLIDVNFTHACIRDANLRGVSLAGSCLNDGDLRDADLRGADFRNTTLHRANLSSANLTDANFEDADLSDANLSAARLTHAMLAGTNLSRANIRGANLNNANFRSANLRGADFREANLRGSDFNGAGLDHADFSGAELDHADFSKVYASFTNFGGIDLRRVAGLSTVKHGGPSTIGSDTFYQSHGDIPDIFLRGCGVPDEMIAFVHSIAGAIQYYTVFISYSSKNHDFAQRLYNDLQGANVRCWFAPRSLKGGDPFWDVIDQSIIQYDKVIVILSESAIQSVPVAHEVRQAINKEQQLQQRGQPKTVLFPLKIDEAIKTTTISWAAAIQNSRHINDFTAWKDADAYQDNFHQLLRDLRAELLPEHN